MNERMSDERLAEIKYTISKGTKYWVDLLPEILQALQAEREDRNDWFHLQQTFERQLNEYIDKVKRRDKRIKELQRKYDALLEVDAFMTDTEEINPSNYDHELVCELNSRFTEAHTMIRAILRGETDDE